MVGKHVFLRALEPADTDLLYQWENDTSIWNLSNTLAPFSRYALEQYVLNSSYDIFTVRQLRLMVMLNETPHLPVGTIDLFDFDPHHQRAGVGIMLLPESRFQGYGTESLQLLLHYAFKTLNLHQLYCNILTDNTSSLNMFTKAGFTIIGIKKQWHLKEGEWFDEYMLQLLNPNHLI